MLDDDDDISVMSAWRLAGRKTWAVIDRTAAATIATMIFGCAACIMMIVTDYDPYWVISMIRDSWQDVTRDRRRRR